MTLSSDMVRLDIVDSLYRPHLKVVMVHNSVRYTTTGEIHRLFRNKPLVDSIAAQREQRLYEQMRMRHDDNEEDEHDSRYL